MDVAVAASTSALHRHPELLLQLQSFRDLVLSGTHPTIKLPTSGIAQSYNEKSGAPDARTYTSAATGAAASIAPTPNIPDANLSLASASNPVTLQSPEEIARAAIALKRQRIEDSLRAEAEGERSSHQHHKGNKDNDILAGPNAFDIAQVMDAAARKERALTAALASNAVVAHDSSVDEDSYYSSKAPGSWDEDSEEGEVIEHDQVHAPATNLGSTVGMNAPLAMHGREESYSPPPAPLPAALPAMSHSRGVPHVSLSDRDRDSESYSPPLPSEPVVRNESSLPTGPKSARNGAPMRWQQSGQESGAFNVNNQKKGKNENQPSKFLNKRQRKELQLQQLQASASNPANGADGSRKRRRDEDANINTNSSSRRTSGKFNGSAITNASSPVPYIKPEPASPPPLRRLSGAMPPPPIPSSSATGRVGGSRLIRREDGRMELLLSEDSTEARPLQRRDDIVPRPLYRADAEDLSQAVRHSGDPPHAVNADRLLHDPPLPHGNDLRYARAVSGPVMSHTVSDYASDPFFHVQRPPSHFAFNEGRLMPPPPKRRYVMLEDGQEYVVLPTSSQTRQSLAPDAFPREQPHYRYAELPVEGHGQARHTQVVRRATSHLPEGPIYTQSGHQPISFEDAGNGVRPAYGRPYEVDYESHVTGVAASRDRALSVQPFARVPAHAQYPQMRAPSLAPGPGDNREVYVVPPPPPPPPPPLPHMYGQRYM